MFLNVLVSMVSLGVVVFLYVFFKYYLLPKRLYDHYCEIFQQLGYNVYKLPFQAFAAPYFQKYQKYLQSHGDSLYLEKNVFHKYDIVVSNVLDTICLTFENVQLVKQFYQPQSINKFVKHPTLSLGIKMTLGEGIIFSQKQIWKKKRKIVSKAFNYELLTKNISVIAKIADQTFQQLQNQYLDTQQDFFEFQPKQLGFRIFSRVMMICFFQTQFKQNKINGKHAYKFLQQLFQEITWLSNNILVMFFGSLTYKLGLTSSHRRLRCKVSILQHQVLGLINQKVQGLRAQPYEIKSSFPQNENCDLIKRILQQKLAGESTYDTKQLIQQFCTFLIAGTDTTTNFLRSIVYYLCKYPQSQKKLRKQIEDNIRTQVDIENAEILKRLTYLDCVQKEVIRMAGPSATCFMRIAENDCMLRNIRLKKDTGVFIQPMANHYNPLYFPFPFQFRPQRWLEDKNPNIPNSHTGFFGGPRTCIGKQLAYLQSKIVLIKLLRNYKKMEIQVGGQRMQVKFLYGPQKYLLKVYK